MTRKCRTDIKLSNNITLLKGTHIGVAAGANALDPQYFDDPDTFDGFRFSKLRALPGNDNKYQVSHLPHQPIYTQETFPNSNKHPTSLSPPTTQTSCIGA